METTSVSSSVPSSVASSPRQSRICLGKNKQGKACCMDPLSDSNYCKFHIGQEADLQRRKEIDENPLFQGLTDEDVKELGREYHIKGNFTIYKLKERILHMKPIIERKKQREEDIWYRCLNLVKSKSECETKEEQENWDKSDRRFETHIQYVQDTISKMIKKYEEWYDDTLIPIFTKKYSEYRTLDGTIVEEPMSRGVYKPEVKFQVITERNYDSKFIDYFKKVFSPESIKSDYYQECYWTVSATGPQEPIPLNRLDITNHYSSTYEFLKSEEDRKPDSLYWRTIDRAIKELNDPDNFQEIRITNPVNRVKPEEPKDICFCRKMYSKSEYEGMVKRFTEHNYEEFNDEEIALIRQDIYGYDWSMIGGKCYSKSDVETKLKEYYIFPENFTEQERNDLDFIIEGKNSSCASSCRNSPAPSPKK